MDTVEFPTLAAEDRDVVEQFAAGLGRDAARVLAYLILRRGWAADESDQARMLALRVGTGLSRTAIGDALTRLEERGLITATSVEQTSPGRPPKAWAPAADRDSTFARACWTHADALLGQTATLAGPSFEPADPSDAPFEAGEQQSRDLEVALNWHPNSLQVPLYAADCAGAFSTRDLDVDFRHHRGSHLALEAVSGGDADVGLVGAGTTVRARAADRGVVPVAALYQRTATVLYTTRERFGEPLESVDQLRGRRIATAEGSETCLLARLFLSQANLLEAVELIDAANEERDALRAGVADVATGSFADPLELEDENTTVNVLPIGDHYPIYGPMFVVREHVFAERVDALRRFLAGATAGWAEARRNPDRAVERIASESDDSASHVRRLFDHAVEEFGTSEAVRAHGWGWLDSDTWERLETALTHGDLLEAPS